MPDTLTAIGLMSGTSLDGIDAAILRTDGEDVVEAGPAIQVPYSRELKIWVRRAIKAALEGRDGAEEIGKAAGEVTLATGLRNSPAAPDAHGRSGTAASWRPKRVSTWSAISAATMSLRGARARRLRRSITARSSQR